LLDCKTLISSVFLFILFPRVRGMGRAVVDLVILCDGVVVGEGVPLRSCVEADHQALLTGRDRILQIGIEAK